ncbi:MAG: hypothetical protein HZA50_11345 [Planctomycetes bacterium]|nr:hypothetical protein [Planctomycetota bacterium]
MKRHMIIAAVALTAWVATPVWGAETKIVRFVSQEKGNCFGQPVIYITYVPPDSNTKASIAAFNSMGKFAEGLKFGDYITLEINAMSAGSCSMPYVAKISKYTLKPGEDELGVFVFSNTSEQVVQGKKMMVLEATRFGKSYSFLAGPANVAKDAVSSVGDLSSFSKGDLIEIIPVANSQTVIKNVYRYTPPQTGELVKTELRDVSEQKFQVVELKLKDKTVVYQVPNVGAAASQKPQPDLLAKINKLKTGSMVTVRVRQIGETLWLVDIKPAVEVSATASGQKPVTKG